MEDNKKFQRGDIITKKTTKGWFVIYEGRPISVSTYITKYSLVLAYDAAKYQKNEETGVFEKMPYLSYATSTTPCLDTIDEEKETFWYKIADEDEEAEFNVILASLGLQWDKETFTLSDVTSGRIIKQLKQPSVDYDGRVIKPSTELLLETCAKTELGKPKTVYTPQYQERWRDEYDDYYNRRENWYD